MQNWFALVTLSHGLVGMSRRFEKLVYAEESHKCLLGLVRDCVNAFPWKTLLPRNQRDRGHNSHSAWPLNGACRFPKYESPAEYKTDARTYNDGIYRMDGMGIGMYELNTHISPILQS